MLILDGHVADAKDLQLVRGSDRVFRRAKEHRLRLPGLKDEVVVVELLPCRLLDRLGRLAHRRNLGQLVAARERTRVSRVFSKEGAFFSVSQSVAKGDLELSMWALTV